MSISIQIPTSLRLESGADASEFEVSAETVDHALSQLEQTFPAVYRCVCDETGAVRRHINLFVNHTLLPRPQAREAKLVAGDVLFIMTAVSGG